MAITSESFVRLFPIRSWTRHYNSFQQNIDELIRSSVESYTKESSLFQALFHSDNKNFDTQPDTNANSTGYDFTDNDTSTTDHHEMKKTPEELESEFDKNIFYSDDTGYGIGIEMYNQLLETWVRSRRANALAKCEDILLRMKYAEVEPNVDTYNIIISLWASQSGESFAQKAYTLFQHSKDYRLRSRVYDALISSIHTNIESDLDKFSIVHDIMSLMLSKDVPISANILNLYGELLLQLSGRPVHDLSSLLQKYSSSISIQEYYIRALCAEGCKTRNRTNLEVASTKLKQLLAENNDCVSPEVLADVVSAWVTVGSLEDIFLLHPLLCNAVASGIPSSHSTSAEPWNQLLRYYRQNITYESGIQVNAILESMFQLHVRPNAECFETAVVLWSELDQYEEAFHAYRNLVSIGLSPTFATLRALILLQLRQTHLTTYIASEESVDCLLIKLFNHSDSLPRCKVFVQEVLELNYVMPFTVFKSYLRALSVSPQRGNAEAAILLIKTLERKQGSTFPMDLECFEFLFRTFETSSSLSHADNAWNALRYMKSLQIPPSLQVYQSLLWTWVNSKRNDAPTMCMSILADMKEYKVQPTTATYNIALKAWSRSLLPVASTKVEEILQEMQERGLTPDGASYALSAYALSRSRNKSIELLSIEKLYGQLCEYVRLYPQDPLHQQHLQSLHRSLINVWSTHRSSECLDKLCSLLEAMTVYGLVPHPSAYNTIASAWGPEGVSRARSLLNRLIDRGITGRRLATAYNLVLACGKRSVSVTAAEELFHAMSSEFSPDIVSYNILLETIGGSGARDCIKRCDSILSRMSVSPDDHTLVVMQKIWSNKLSPAESVSRADELFRRIPNPSLSSFSYVISGWCKVNASKASSLIDKMISSYHHSQLTESTLYTPLIEAVAKSRQAPLADKLLRNLIENNLESKPNSRCVRFVLEAWVHSGVRDCGEKAHNILDLVLSQGGSLDSDMLQYVSHAWVKQGDSNQLGRVDRLFERAKRENLELNEQILRNMLLLYGRMRDAAQQAEDVLFQLIERGGSIDQQCYNIAIEAWGRSKWMNAGGRAEALFQKLRSIGFSPDVVSYSSLISALTKKFDADMVIKAYDYFLQMCAEGVEPDSRAYTIMITIWAKARLPNSEERVRELFHQMVEEGCAPSVVTYTAMLSMYGGSKDPHASAYIIDIFDRIKHENLRLDTAGYSTLLSTIGKSNDPKAPYQAERVFEEMCAAGVDPDATAWNVLISIWARSKLDEKYTKAEDYFNRMMESGCSPNEFLVSTMLKMWTFAKQNSFTKSKVINLYNYLTKAKIAMDAYAIKVLIQALMKTMSPAAALDKVEKLLEHMIDFGIFPEAGCFSATIKADPSPRAYERGFRFVRMINNSGRKPSKEIYRSILSSLENCRDETSQIVAMKKTVVKALEDSDSQVVLSR